MNRSAVQHLRQRLREGHTAYGLWVTLESPSISEMAVALGLDWIVLDAEHGHLDWSELVAHVRTTVRSETVVLIRIAELNAGLVKRALDIGADGVVVPWIETAEQCQRAVAYALYPPEGARGIGAERATAWAQSIAEETATANDSVLVVPLIESVKAERNLEEICRVPHADIFFLGPHDFAATAGFRGNPDAADLPDRLDVILQKLRAQGKSCGIVASGPADLVDRRQQGFNLLCLGIDGGLLLRSLHESLGVVGRDRLIDTSFKPHSPFLPLRPLQQLPPSLRPDRMEAMHRAGSGKSIDLAPNVTFECHVGSHNGARDLTTGIAEFPRGGNVSYHTHEFTESITVLTGELLVLAEGREYRLEALDNIVIPRRLPHGARCDFAAGARVHVAMGSASPARALVDDDFAVTSMPMDSTGVAPKERVTRWQLAEKYEAGPRTSFVDYFNRELVPGIEICGGYAAFEPGGRLPAHVHYFDESICIISGDATCIVEGRHHTMAGITTALQPKGRVHYFVNETPNQFAMIWVYAGPSPDRIVVAEALSTRAGSPWSDTTIS